MATLERALNSIGKECFIKYYDDFKTVLNNNNLAKRLLQENSKASSLQAQITRINYAKWIFQNKLEKDALKTVLSSKRLSNEIHIQAQKLLEAITS